MCSLDNVRSQRVLQKWLLQWFGSCESEELCMGMTVLYQLWLARNEARVQTCIEDPEKTDSWSMFLVKEWKAA
jgi:hypothetical protein